MSQKSLCDRVYIAERNLAHTMSPADTAEVLSVIEDLAEENEKLRNKVSCQGCHRYQELLKAQEKVKELEEALKEAEAKIGDAEALYEERDDWINPDDDICLAEALVDSEGFEDLVTESSYYVEMVENYCETIEELEEKVDDMIETFVDTGEPTELMLAASECEDWDEWVEDSKIFKEVSEENEKRKDKIEELEEIMRDIRKTFVPVGETRIEPEVREAVETLLTLVEAH
jgi:uncharacterized protein YukE